MNFENKAAFFKQMFFTVFGTILILALTNQWWLITEPVHIELDIKGDKGQSKFSAELNKNDSDSFQKTQSDITTVDMEKNSHIVFNINQIKFPKRIRFLLSYTDENKVIEINNITIQNQKWNNKNYEKIVAQGANIISTDDNGIKIRTKSGFPILIYPEKLNITANTKFNYQLFFIIFVFSFIIFFKLTNLVFSLIKKGESLFDILLVFVFIFALFVPASNINQEYSSKRENRALAKWVPLYDKQGNINLEFGKNFDEWFCDRFYLRSRFLNIYQTAKFKINKNKETQGVIFGENNFLFCTWDNELKNYLNAEKFTESELEKILLYLEKLNDYCKEHNKKFYFIIPPDKNKVYGEYFPKRYHQISKFGKAEQLIEYISKNSKIKVYYLKDTITNNKLNGLMYFKNDTHWTNKGAYVAYREIIKILNEDKFNIKEAKIKNIRYEKHDGDIQDTLLRSFNYKDDTEYENYDFENDYKIIKKDSSYKNSSVWKVPALVTESNYGKYNCVVIRDSFSFYLMQFFSRTFKKTYYYWNQFNVKRSDLKDGDIIILECVERMLPMLLEAKVED